MDIPRDKSYPANSVQCNSCGGHGCVECDERGWFTPKDHPNGRKCENSECNKPLEPDCVPVYCSNDCALDDAQEEAMKSKAERIIITDTRPDFDRACESAYMHAVSIWEIDDCGHSKKLPDFHRSSSSIHVKFVSYEQLGSMVGHSYTYVFETWMEKLEDEDEDEEEE